MDVLGSFLMGELGFLDGVGLRRWWMGCEGVGGGIEAVCGADLWDFLR